MSMKDNIIGSEANANLCKCMHYRHNEFQNFLQNLALDAHDALHRKSTLHGLHPPLLAGWGGDDKLVIDKGGNLPEKVENHCPRPYGLGGWLVENPRVQGLAIWGTIREL